MQTFLPYSSFIQTALCLDRLRLGKQRLEAKEIIAINLFKSDDERFDWNFLLSVLPGWRYNRYKNHPVIRMWEGYEGCLCNYGIKICVEWRNRGYNDKQLDWFIDIGCSLNLNEEGKFNEPPFIGNEAFHSSHRAALLSKNINHYKQFGWKEVPRLNYVWTV